MFNKKILLCICIFCISVLAVASASAAEIDTDNTSNDDYENETVEITKEPIEYDFEFDVINKHPIKIYENTIINGNGHTLTVEGSVFDVINGDKVIIKNLTLIMKHSKNNDTSLNKDINVEIINSKIFYENDFYKDVLTKDHQYILKNVLIKKGV